MMIDDTLQGQTGRLGSMLLSRATPQSAIREMRPARYSRLVLLAAMIYEA